MGKKARVVRPQETRHAMPGESDSSQRPVAARRGASASGGQPGEPDLRLARCGAARAHRRRGRARRPSRRRGRRSDRRAAPARRRSPGTGASGCAADGLPRPGSDRRARVRRSSRRAAVATGMPPASTRSTRNAPRQAAISWRPARLRSTTRLGLSVDADGAAGRQQPAAIAAQLAGSRRPATLRPGRERLVHQALDQGRGRCFAERGRATNAARLGAGARPKVRARRPDRGRSRRRPRSRSSGGDLVDDGRRVLDALALRRPASPRHRRRRRRAPARRGGAGDCARSGRRRCCRRRSSAAGGAAHRPRSPRATARATDAPR